MHIHICMYTHIIKMKIHTHNHTLSQTLYFTHEIKVTGHQTPCDRHYQSPVSREHSSRPIRGASRVCYWSSDFGAGVLIHSAVGKADKVLACVCVSKRKCVAHSVPIRPHSPSLEAEQIVWISSPSGREFSPTPPRPPTHTYAHMHVYSYIACLSSFLPFISSVLI